MKKIVINNNFSLLRLGYTNFAADVQRKNSFLINIIDKKIYEIPLIV